jgi:AcrR family transcriptional regulator
MIAEANVSLQEGPVKRHNERTFSTICLNEMPRSTTPVRPPHPTPAAHAAHAAVMRERIVEGAKRAFAASGFRGAAVPVIAAEAGVSVGLIYRYFPSKEELFLAVCERETQARLDDLATGLGRIGNPRERLAAAVELFVASLVEENWGAIVVHAWAEADRNPRVRDTLQRLFDQQRGFAAMFVREAIARGEAPGELDVEAISTAAALLLHGAIAYQAERGSGFDPEAIRRALTAILGTNLRPR